MSINLPLEVVSQLRGMRGLTVEDLENPEVVALCRELVDLEPELVRMMCRVDLVYFCVNILGYRDLDHDIYRQIAEPFNRRSPEHVYHSRTKEKPYTLTLIPRGTMKSSLISEGSVLQDIIRFPNTRILLTNAVMELPRKFLYRIKKHIVENAEFKRIFGDIRREDEWRVEEITVNTRTKEFKEMTVEIASEGNTKTGKHYTRIIADDLVTRDNIKTVESMYATFKYYQDLFDLLDNPGGVVDVIGTRWDYNDLYGMIVDPQQQMCDDFVVFIKKAYEGEFEEGRFNFPWKLDAEELMKKKRQKTAIEFAAQYLNDPSPEEDATFKKSYFRYYTGAYPKDLTVFMMVDPAATQNKTSDYSAIICIGVSADNKWYVLDMIRDKLQPGQLSKVIYHMAEKYNPTVIGIESAGFQAYIQHDLMQKMRTAGNMFTIKPVKHKKQAKTDRIKGLEPMFRAGDIYFPRALKYTNTDGIELDLVFALKDELVKFPRAMKDDLSDCLAYFIQFAFVAPTEDNTPTVPLYEGTDGLSRLESLQRAKLAPSGPSDNDDYEEEFI